MPARKQRPLTVEITGPDADGRYHGFVQLGVKPNGKPDRRHRSGRDRAEVERKLRALEEAREHGDQVPVGQPWTVERWLTHWLENIVKPNRRPKTYKAYRPLVRQHLIPGIGGRRLAGTDNLLTPEDIERVYAGMKDAKKRDGKPRYAPSYIHACHRVLVRALKVAHLRDRASRNAALLVEEPPKLGKRRKIKAHSLEEAQQLLAAIGRSDQPARWLIAVMLGLRQGEVLGLRWPLIKLDAKVPTLEVETQSQRRDWQHGCEDPTVCAAEHCRTKPCPPSWSHGCDLEACGKGNPRCCPARVQVHCKRHRTTCPPPCEPGCTGHARACPDKVGGGMQLVDLKSDESNRPIELPPVLVQALRAHRAGQREAQLAAAAWGNEQDLVFTDRYGRPVDPRRDHEAWERLLVDADLPDGPLHGARHDAGTLLLATGADLRVVQSILGHSSIKVTELYADVAAELRRKALEQLAEQLLGGGGLLPGLLPRAR